MPPYFLIMTRGLFAEKGERDRGGEWGKEGRVWGAGMRFCTFLVKGALSKSASSAHRFSRNNLDQILIPLHYDPPCSP